MDNKSYHISFFKPTTEHSRKNRNMVIWFVSIWALAIFGFQITLRIIEKPTPQPSYLLYESVWEDVKSAQASQEAYQDFAYASLSVLGKIFISAEEKGALERALTFVTMQLVDTAEKAQLKNEIIAFETVSDTISDIGNPHYQHAKKSLIDLAAPILGIDKLDARRKIIPHALKNMENISLRETDIRIVESAMPKYLIHNQSVLTDIKFLGFPFHYFYSSIFLLVLFVGICWMYCKRIDNMYANLNITD